MYEEEKKGTTRIPFMLTVVAVGILTVVYLFLESDSAKTLILILSVTTILIGGAYLYWQIFMKEKLLRKKLDHFNQIAPEEGMDQLKTEYLQIYRAYLNLSEKQKQNFYVRVKNLREKLEEQLLAEKKIQELLQQEGSLKERQQYYAEIHRLFQKLPRKMQDKYYPELSHLRDKLERGQ